MKLYSAQVCPFAQRTRALLVHLDVPFELHEIDLRNRDPEFLRLSPSGRVPMLVDDGFRLYESQVINEYLAEAYGWRSALASDARLRAYQRLAMKQWDEIVVETFYDSMGAGGIIDPKLRGRVERELDQLAMTVDADEKRVHTLLGFHCAPHWARMDWLRQLTGLAELVDERPDLRTWLQRALKTPAIQDTLPGREVTVARYEQRYAGKAT